MCIRDSCIFVRNTVFGLNGTESEFDITAEHFNKIGCFCFEAFSVKIGKTAGIGSEFKLQLITAQRLIFEAVLFVQLVVPVFSVTEQSVTDIRKVRSYLMRPACEQIDL